MLEVRGTAGLQPLGSGAGMVDQWLWQCGSVVVGHDEDFK